MQLAETFKKGGTPTFVDTLDAVEVGKKSGMPIAPVMIYGDDVSHVVSEEGIAYLYKAQGQEERRAALAAIGGATSVGRRADTTRSGRAAGAGHRGVSRRSGCAPPAGQPLDAGGAEH